MDEGLLTGAECLRSCITRAHLSVVTVHQSWKPAQPTGSVLPGSSVGLSLFEAAWLVSAPSRQCFWPEGLLHSLLNGFSAYILVEGGGGGGVSVESVWFQGFPEAIMSCLLAEFKDLHCRMECFTSS